MVQVRLIAVSMVTTRKRSDDCGISLVDSSAMREKLECPALMVEVNQGLKKQYR